jgi:exopolysaccharide production protein ExoZ
MVVLFHYRFYTMEYLGHAPVFTRAFEGDHSGVEFFFVLSGFIIYLIHRNDIGLTHRALPFLRKRFIRIVPMYWIVVTASLLAFSDHPGWGGSKGLTLHNIVFDYLLLPTDGFLVLAPAWTLKAEALFYAFVFLAILQSTIGVACFVVWQATIVALNALAMARGWALTGPYLGYVLDIHNVGFGVGVLCSLWCLETRSPSPRALLSLLSVGIIGVFSIVAYEGVENLNFDNLQNFRERTLISAGYTLSYALIIISAARLEQIFKPNWNRVLVIFGASSYSLYLVHDPLASLMGKWAAGSRVFTDGREGYFYMLAVCVAVAVAFIVHLFVEKPLTGALKRFLRRSGFGDETTVIPDIRLHHS